MATNLEFIKSASGTSVSSLSVTDCFSDKYDVYQIVITELDMSTSSATRLRVLDSGGSPITTSVYDDANLLLIADRAFQEERDTNITYVDNFAYATNSNLGSNVNIMVYNPYNSSSYTFFSYQASQWEEGISALVGRKSIAVVENANTHTGFQIIVNTGTIDSIKLSVYGVK